MIKCELQPMPEYGNIATANKSRKKFGRYHGSMFWDLPGFGSKKWIVATKIEIKEHVDEEMEDKELITQCVDYINTPPPRKKFGRRVRKPKYGKLEVYSAKVHRVEGKSYISALLITDVKSSKHFWGRGIVV